MNTQIALFAVSFLASAAVIVACSMALRYKTRELQHRERLAALEKGVSMLPASESAPWTPLTNLRRGLIWLFTGIAIAIFLFAVSFTSRQEVPASIRVADANRAKAEGATDEQVRAIMEDRGRNGMPPGVALIGLIPFGVGLAYLITYRSEMASQRAERIQ